jgi:hypothetical protein
MKGLIFHSISFLVVLSFASYGYTENPKSFTARDMVERILYSGYNETFNPRNNRDVFFDWLQPGQGQAT